MAWHPVPANVLVHLMKRLAVNRNNCKVIISSRKVFMLGNTETDSQTDLFVLESWPCPMIVTQMISLL